MIFSVLLPNCERSRCTYSEIGECFPASKLQCYNKSITDKNTVQLIKRNTDKNQLKG